LRESDAAAARRAGSARGRTNLEFVAELWRAFETGGAAAIADLVPPDVEWRPLQTGGEDLRGTPGLREFWAPPNLAMPTPQMFQAHGDDVLVHAERRWWRLQRCPVGRHWSIVSPVDESSLSLRERRSARRHRDARVP
jgi:hypothetical protein